MGLKSFRVAKKRLKAGSEYDASHRRKRNAEIEIESIHAFSVALRLRRGLVSYSEPGLREHTDKVGEAVYT